MVQQDEHLAHERIQDTFNRFSETIKKYSGKVLELRGDALLAEFERPSDALNATLAFQSSNSRYLSTINDDLKPEIRAGIAMGEVVVANNTITGAGVVMAQRVEQLAKKGGLCITSAVRESLSKRLSVEFENLGQQDLKGFQEPVAVYRVTQADEAAIPLPETKGVSRPPKIPLLQIGALSVAALMIVIGVVYWVNRGETLGETASTESMALPLPDNPAIAVLPFSNLSGDTQQDYFSDGITNDIITDLSQVSNLLVIASNSVFVYKNNPVKVQQVAQDLGVTHVLEGSVQKSGNQVRINAQLIDASSGHHLWAERFDRELVDIFKLQDEVSRKIVDTLAVKLTRVEQRLLDRDRPADPQAYDMLLQGLEQLRRFTRGTNAEARRYFQEAIQFDPGFARAYADVAFSHAMDFLFGWEEASDEKFRVAFEYADKAVALDDTIGQVHFARGVLYLTAKDHASAIESAFRAVKTHPNYADGWANVAQVLVYSGKPEESLENMSIAKELNPRYAFFYTWIEGHARMLLGEYEAAEEAFLDVIERNPHFPGAHLTLASLYGNLGQTEQAEWAALEIMTLNPQFSIADEAARVPYKLKQHLDSYVTGLRKAGLPE
jgi:TolB-like protein/Flp pilus assembly protein TadD